MGYKYSDSTRSSDFVAMSKNSPLSAYVEIYQVCRRYDIKNYKIGQI